MSDTFECNHCGATVSAKAKVCRECGSDDLTGWKSYEEQEYMQLDIPDGYGPDDDSTQLPSGTPRWIVVTALVVAIAMVAWLVL